MKIAYVTTYDARDVRNWSGLARYIADSLRDQSLALHYVGPLHEKYAWLFKAKKGFCRIVHRKRYLPDRAPAILKGYARQVAENLSGCQVDAVFSPGTIPIAYLDCRTPVAFWTDATFSRMVDFYPSFTNLHEDSVKEGMAMERAALERCRLAIYSSEWAARSAIDDYQTHPSKVKVVPFGANIECNRTIDDIHRLISHRPPDRCKLLFLGVDWDRKGGDQALAVAEGLNAAGLPTELTIVGCHPPASRRLPDHVRVIGFVSKSSAQGDRTISSILSGSHFLILPSSAECTPVVFSEANSFGVPSLTTNVGGIPTVINDGVNGKMFGAGFSVDDCVGYVLSLMNDYDRYKDLAISSFREYETRLNWRVAAKRVKRMLEEIVS
jgi:glycosyltransferase involved in cell wall biosynthesis